MRLPKTGMGTFGSDKYPAGVVASAVESALEAGYRLFDCASVYGNEREIGEVFGGAYAKGKVRRGDVFIMSKLWNDAHGRAAESCEKSISDLKADYLDVYFMHWPFPNTHAAGCGGDSRDKDSRPFIIEEFLRTWSDMEKLKKRGLVREIALSNMTVAKLEAVWDSMDTKPYALECELHLSFQQRELTAFCKEKGIVNVGYCPLGSPNRPQRDVAEGDIADTAMPQVREIAEKRGVSPAEICIAWAVNSGIIPIPFSSNPAHIACNLKAADIELTPGEMQLLGGAECNNRLIKGQVFLWNGSESWRDLWDEDGRLAGWEKRGNTWKKI